MEDKIRRESKKLLERMFKAKDTKGNGAIPLAEMKKIMHELCPSHDPEELNEMMEEVKKDAKFSERNPKTNKFELKTEKDTIDFPSALAIAVHFLAREERKASRAMSFSGRALIRLNDMPSMDASALEALAALKQPAKRMY